MLNKFKNIDNYSKNIMIVFLGSFLANFFNLLYQLFIAHKLSPQDFSAFNSLLSIFLIISSPLVTIQMALTKYISEFNSRKQPVRVKLLLSDSFRQTSILAILTFFTLWFSSANILKSLKITYASSGYLFALLIALTWINPVVMGAVQGLELFWLFSVGSLAASVIKLALVVLFVILGYSVSGALGALLISTIINILIFYFPLRHLITFWPKEKEDIDYGEIIGFLFPIAISNFCFMALVNADMVLARYFFGLEESGAYSLAQMLGKIFLFLPMAISFVMFPRTSALKAMQRETSPTLNKSLIYVSGLLISACLFYNIFPVFVLKILTGKALPESVALGRLFSISMSFFALAYIMICYFLSIKDMRFIKYLVLFTALEIFAILRFHGNLIQIQLILCLSAILLFFSQLIFVYSKARR